MQKRGKSLECGGYNMLKLRNIKKDYDVVDFKVEALKGININFRKSEFVSVLGPSGCGKTTLLNLIGGLDQATDGDLLIWGRSTKRYTDRDWDVYRNHRIGFVFQTYNLIPHQSVLANVELALTIAGISKEVRVKRAKEALDKVGLSDQYYKKPNQLSGGQSQRVAIARALVNDPEILLADEPTGALDTKTSEQILDLIKEISHDRLVIMVTHNSELAERYSTRIVRLLDGELVGDSHPFSNANEKRESREERARLKALQQGVKQKERARMSFWTAFKLSMQNIFTKKKRTTLTAIAGSIGIVGVSLVLSVSIGLQTYINDMQNDMLAGNPIQIQQTAFDINALSEMTYHEQKEVLEKGDYVNVSAMIKELHDQLGKKDDFVVENKITRDYVNYLNEMPQDYVSALRYNYGIDVSTSFYTSFSYPTKENGRTTSIRGIKTMYESLLTTVEGFEEYASLVSMLDTPFAQAPDTRNEVTEEYVLSQYDVLYAKPGTNGVAKEKHEIMLVLDKNRAVADLTLGHIGYYSQEVFINLVNRAIGNEFDAALYPGNTLDYEDLATMKYTWYDNDTIYAENNVPGIPFMYSPYADASFVNGLELEVVGIVEPKENLNYGMLSSGIYYSTALAEHIVTTNYNSELATYLREEVKADALNGMAVIMNVGGVDVIQVMEDGEVIAFDYEFAADTQSGVKQGKSFVNNQQLMQGIMGMFTDFASLALVKFDAHDMGVAVEPVIQRDANGEIISWDVWLDENGDPFALPSSISIYPPSFTQKDKALAWLDAWNDSGTITLTDGTVLTAEMREEVVYMDMLSLVMKMISTLLTAVTVALVSFTSLALIVSSVMIAIITYVSVVERIKEIGVIRSLGGRKKDVSNLFIAETFIIGFISGAIGISVTYLLSLIANLIVVHLVGVTIARFPWWVAAIMLSISVLLTLISGLMPSKSAAKKDPVVALRTE